MKNKIYKFILPISVLVLPILAMAQEPRLEGIRGIALGLDDLVQILLPVAFSLALLFFFYGVAKYIWSEGQGKEDGRKIMIWGVVALFVMTSIWGIIQFMADELQIWDPNDNNSMKIPTIDR